MEAGKEHWLEKRKDPVHAKRKGIVETFWIIGSKNTLNNHTTSRRGSDVNSDSEQFSDTEQMAASFTTISGTSTYENSEVRESNLNVKHAFNLALYDLPDYSANGGDLDLINWHVIVLGGYLQQILYHRDRLGMPESRVYNPGKAIARGSCVFDEVSETTSLPDLNEKSKMAKSDPFSIVLPRSVITHLRDFISISAQNYRSNPFHSFARTTRVSMLTREFLQQIA
jgi:hypothetical protein